jgi:hypothetical protein
MKPRKVVSKQNGSRQERSHISQPLVKGNACCLILLQVFEQAGSIHSIERRQTCANAVEKFTARFLVNLAEANHY